MDKYLHCFLFFFFFASLSFLKLFIYLQFEIMLQWSYFKILKIYIFTFWKSFFEIDYLLLCCSNLNAYNSVGKWSFFFFPIDSPTLSISVVYCERSNDWDLKSTNLRGNWVPSGDNSAKLWQFNMVMNSPVLPQMILYCLLRWQYTGKGNIRSSLIQGSSWYFGTQSFIEALCLK